MSLYATAEVGSLLKEYRPKASTPDKPKTHANSWDYPDDAVVGMEAQDAGGWPDKDDFPPDAEPTFEARQVREPSAPSAKPKVEAAPPNKEYQDWKAAQTRLLAGYDPSQKGRKAPDKVPAVKMPKGKAAKA